MFDRNKRKADRGAMRPMTKKWKGDEDRGAAAYTSGGGGGGDGGGGDGGGGDGDGGGGGSEVVKRE